MIVILEFHEWKESDPVVLPLINEKMKILLQFSVDPLCLPVALRMVSSGRCKFNP
jgi:hypothetical protein